MFCQLQGQLRPISLNFSKIYTLLNQHSLSASDIEQLNRFPCGGYSDDQTIGKN